MSPFPEPYVEYESIATFGSIPNTFAVFAVSIAISVSSSSLGAMLIAQSPIASFLSPFTMMKHELTILLPGFVLISCRAGLTVSAVEYVAPPRRQSALPILTSIVPK